MHAKIFDVDVAAEAGVEEQIPTRVMVVVVNVHLIAFPLPIAAAVEIVGSNDPIEIVVEKDVPSAVIKGKLSKPFLAGIIMPSTWRFPCSKE